MASDRDLSVLVDRQRAVGTAMRLRSLGLLASLIDTGLGAVDAHTLGSDLAEIQGRVRAIAGDLELLAGRVEREGRS